MLSSETDSKEVRILQCAPAYAIISPNRQARNAGQLDELARRLSGEEEIDTGAEAPVVKRYVCKICGCVYEGAELPVDFVCPICKRGVRDFEEIK